MKGLELSRAFYLEHGAPMIAREFPELEGVLAIGLAGSGSECFGYDDGISRDHDFEAGFCLFIPDGFIDSKTEFALERAYSKLPKEFCGVPRSTIDPVGGNRHGVIKIGDFFKDKVGREDGELSFNDWVFLPEQALAEATNGKVFRDDLGIFSKVREKLSYLPEEVRLKKLAGNLLMMAQSGQYNYRRCVGRGESGAAQLAVCEFVKSALNVIFLLNKKYIPYYKWCFRALRDLPRMSELGEVLEYLISSGNDEFEIEKKSHIIEKVCGEIIEELRAQGLTKAMGEDIERHAYSVNDHISNAEIRNLHILYAV